MRRAIFALVLALAACAPAQKEAAAPPANETCALIASHKGWEKALAASVGRWGVPPHVQLAVMRQESNFELPKRPSVQPLTPHGYAQADARTWAAYRRAADRPNAKRQDFADSADFIGWYFHETRERADLPFSRVADHYLAYSRGAYAKGKPSQAARRNAARVAAYARSYEKDLAACPPR